jgi:hypothetical protein
MRSLADSADQISRSDQLQGGRVPSLQTTRFLCEFGMTTVVDLELGGTTTVAALSVRAG